MRTHLSIFFGIFAVMALSNAIVPVRLNGEVIPNKVIFSVLAFMSLYGASIIMMT